MLESRRIDRTWFFRGCAHICLSCRITCTWFFHVIHSRSCSQMLDPPHFLQPLCTCSLMLEQQGGKRKGTTASGHVVHSRLPPHLDQKVVKRAWHAERLWCCDQTTQRSCRGCGWNSAPKRKRCSHLGTVRCQGARISSIYLRMANSAELGFNSVLSCTSGRLKPSLIRPSLMCSWEHSQSPTNEHVRLLSCEQGKKKFSFVGIVCVER
jgi:hypothetical protein